MNIMCAKPITTRCINIKMASLAVLHGDYLKVMAPYVKYKTVINTVYMYSMQYGYEQTVTCRVLASMSAYLWA